MDVYGLKAANAVVFGRLINDERIIGVKVDHVFNTEVRFVCFPLQGGGGGGELEHLLCSIVSAAMLGLQNSFVEAALVVSADGWMDLYGRPTRRWRVHPPCTDEFSLQRITTALLLCMFADGVIALAVVAAGWRVVVQRPR